MSRARALGAILFLAGATLAPGARGDDNACFGAPLQGQRAQRAGRLLEARAHFRVCAEVSCPREIIANCTRWLDELRATTPSIIVVARDAAGRDLPSASVSIDNQPAALVSALAIELDPGPHRIVVRHGDRERTVDIVLHEGEKNHTVAPAFEEVVRAVAPRTDAMVPAPSIALGTWILGGVAAVGLATFAVAGGVGMAERGEKHCATGCSHGDRVSVDAKFLIADISLVVAAAAATGAFLLHVLRPTAATPVSKRGGGQDDRGSRTGP